MHEKQYNSDELHSPLNLMKKDMIVDAKSLMLTDMENPQFDIGMKFLSKKVLKQARHKYEVVRSYKCKVRKNDRIRLSAKCKQGCSWKLFASVMQGESTFQNKSYIPGHSCSKGFSSKNITLTFLSERYMGRIKDDPKIKKANASVRDIQRLGI
ncbi:hypothetical protein ACFX13_022582 [Malus domestica]